MRKLLSSQLRCQLCSFHQVGHYSSIQDQLLIEQFVKSFEVFSRSFCLRILPLGIFLLIDTVESFLSATRHSDSFFYSCISQSVPQCLETLRLLPFTAAFLNLFLISLKHLRHSRDVLAQTGTQTTVTFNVINCFLFFSLSSTPSFHLRILNFLIHPLFLLHLVSLLFLIFLSP